MEKTKYDIFISYRREGGDKYARTIQQALEKQYRVFLDFDELEDGVFDQRIIDAIGESPVFLLILSKGALDRCVNEDDWVRQEILHATKCGCHIVPVTIDDTFEGLPASLPEELRRAVGQHQYSELQMKTLFKASMEKLVRNRIEPYIHREDTESGTEIHIETDADCDMYRFKTFIGHLKADEDNVVRLKPGTYKFKFVSTLYPEAETYKVYDLSPEKTYDFIEVALKKEIELKRKAEDEEKRKDEMKLKWTYRDGKCGFEDELGNIVIPCKWKFTFGFSEGLAVVEDDNDKWGYIDKTGMVAIPCKWKKAYPFSEGLAVVEDDNDKWGYIDKTGMVAIPCKWKTAYHFGEGLAAVKDNNEKWNFIDKTGEVVIRCKWIVEGSFSEGLVLVKDDNDKNGFVDKTGSLVIPCKWKDAYSFSEGLAYVKDDNGKFGFIDKTGAVVIPCNWKDAYSFSGGLARVKDGNGNFVHIDKTGKVIMNDANRKIRSLFSSIFDQFKRLF